MAGPSASEVLLAFRAGDFLASCGNEFLWALVFMPHFPVGGTRYF